MKEMIMILSVLAVIGVLISSLIGIGYDWGQMDAVKGTIYYQNLTGVDGKSYTIRSSSPLPFKLVPTTQPWEIMKVICVCEVCEEDPTDLPFFNRF